MNDTKKSLQEGKVVYEHIGKVRKYIRAVLSYICERSAGTPITIRFGGSIATLPAEDMITMLELVDNDLHGLQIMHEIKVMMAEDVVTNDEYEDEVLLPPRQSFMITDNDHFRAEGTFIDRVINMFFERLQEQKQWRGDQSMINVENIQNKSVEEVHAILKRENLTMSMSYRKGSYMCILRPNYHARTNVVLGRADTYIEAIEAAFRKAGNF